MKLERANLSLKLYEYQCKRAIERYELESAQLALPALDAKRHAAQALRTQTQVPSELAHAQDVPWLQFIHETVPAFYMAMGINLQSAFTKLLQSVNTWLAEQGFLKVTITNQGAAFDLHLVTKPELCVSYKIAVLPAREPGKFVLVARQAILTEERTLLILYDEPFAKLLKTTTLSEVALFEALTEMITHLHSIQTN